MSNECVLVFGASGAIGGAVANWFLGHGEEVIMVARQPPGETKVPWIAWDINGGEKPFGILSPGSVKAAIWAQGANCNDDIWTFDLVTHERIYTANVLYIIASLQVLLNQNFLRKSARLCIVSSIWQEIARQRKLSYCVSKAALKGLVQSLAIDLGKEGHMVNAVLPGPLDTKMTRTNLKPEQLDHLQSQIPLGTLPTLEDVCGLIGFLCSEANTGITGQFVAADRGFSHARIV